MSIKYEERTTFYGRTGLVITTISLLSRDEVAVFNVNAASDVSVSFGELLRRNEPDDMLINPYTGSNVTISHSAIAEALQGMDFDNLFLNISFEFIPDAYGPILSPSVLADYMRSRSWPEEEVQELLDWEKTVKEAQQSGNST